LLAASVLEEVLLWHNPVGVFSSEINVFHVLLAMQGITGTLCCEANLEIDTIVNNDVKSICELLDFISIADDIHNLFFVWLQDTMALNDLPNAFLQFSEGSVFRINLTLVANTDFLHFILKDLNVSIVNFSTINSYDGAD